MLVGSLIILLAVMVGIVYVGVIMNSVTIRVESPEKANLYVFALYPTGFKNIGKYKIPSGKSDITLYLRDLKQVWINEYKRNRTLSQPLLLLVAVSKDKIAVKGVNFDWDHLKSKSVELKFKEIDELKKLSSRLDLENFHTLDDFYWSIEDVYERTLPVILCYINPDDSSWGAVDFFCAGNFKVGFSVNVFMGSWSVAGYNVIQKDDYGSAMASFPTGDDYYIWMDVRYRYEKWVMYLDDEPISTMEIIYVKDFYPSTIAGVTYKPPNAQLPDVDEWEYKYYTSTRRDYPYYELDVSNFGADHFAIDCMKFIDALVLAGKISSRAATAASAIGLFTDVDFEYDDVVSFYFSVVLYSNSGKTHHVRLAKSKAVITAPQIYIDVD